MAFPILNAKFTSKRTVLGAIGFTVLMAITGIVQAPGWAADKSETVIRKKGITPLDKSETVIRKKGTTPLNIAPEIPKTTLLQNTFLQVREHSGGEFGGWLRFWTITSPQRLSFRYWTTKAQAVKGFWQIAEQPFKSYSDQVPPGLLHSGFLPTPKTGKVQGFDIDLTKIPKFPKLPSSQPRTYYVRAITLDAKNQYVGHSSSVKILYAKPSDQPTVFTDLSTSIYKLDRDQDGLPDLLERQLAEQFKPYFIFDSDEKARRSNEPVVLFQVRPEGCIGPGCNKAYQVRIKYIALFANDGGYGPSSDCSNTHEGDNVDIDALITNEAEAGWGSVWNGLNWQLKHIKNWKFEWPQSSANFHSSNFGNMHPVIFLSAHKHHQYFDTHRDGKDSIYSGWGCNDDVNGKGAKVFSNLISPLADKRPNNVGEPEAHDNAYFINDLSIFGYPGDSAWGKNPFRGGDTILKNRWMRH